MNWLLVVVLAVIALCIMNGYHKGFLRMVYSLVSWIVVLVFVTWATPYINSYIKENTGIYQEIEKNCEERMRESAKGKTEEQIQENASLADLGLSLPDSVTEKILSGTTQAAGELVESSGIYEAVAGGVADFIVEGISFFIAMIAASVLMHIISQLLGTVSRIPILRGANRTLGLFAGAIYGLALVWIAFYIIALCGTSEAGKDLIALIYESRLLTYLYENNAVLTLIMYFL